jgi:predicted porin
MNKKLVAVAVAGLLAAPLAQAQTANVTLYGSFRVAAEYAKYAGPTASTSVPSIDDVSSRFGLRGSESLGGGMNAIFQCETGVKPDNPGFGGSASLCGREGWVGLNGNWGEVKLGFGLTPYDDVLGEAHQQGANSWENRNNGVSGGAGFAKQGLFLGSNQSAANVSGQALTNTGAFDARVGNSISYKTPTFAGFWLRTQYALLDESLAKKARLWDTAGLYKNGPFVGGLTYALHKNWAGLGGTILGENDQQALRGYAAWNFGMFQVNGTLERAKYDFDNGPDYKFTYYDVGVLAPIGAWKLGAQYSNRDKGLAHAFNSSTNTYNPTPGMLSRWDEGGGKHWSLTADYSLSKRTTLRAYYSWMRNEGTFNPVAISTINPMIGNSKVTAISAGLWHAF